MNLMRNSGFELGNADYWESEGFASFAVTSTSPVFGTYSAELVTSADVYQKLRNTDLIEVNAGDVVQLAALVKGVVASYAAFRLLYYTKRGVAVGYDEGGRHVSDANAHGMEDTFIIPSRASYVAYELILYNPGADVTYYVDVCTMQVNPSFQPGYQEAVLCDLTGITANGDSKSYYQMMKTQTTYYAYLEFDAKTGHTADCTVLVVEKAPTGDWFTVGTFAAIAIDGEERILLSNITGRVMAVTYDFGVGTINCEVKVVVIGKG